MADNYFQLLKHPKWQEKRLRVMENAGFECVYCGSSDKTLNVHHRYYLKGKKPWEYPDEHFDCLCEVCHVNEHAKRDELKVLMGSLCLKTEVIIGYVKGLIMEDYAGPDDQTRFPVSSCEEVSGMAQAYGITGNAGEDAILSLVGAEPDKCVTHAILWRVRQMQMTPSELLKHCRACGVSLSIASDGSIRCSSKQALLPELRAAILNCKPELLAILRDQQSPDALNNEWQNCSVRA